MNDQNIRCPVIVFRTGVGHLCRLPVGEKLAIGDWTIGISGGLNVVKVIMSDVVVSDELVAYREIADVAQCLRNLVRTKVLWKLKIGDRMEPSDMFFNKGRAYLCLRSGGLLNEKHADHYREVTKSASKPKDLRSPLAKARDDWFASDDGQQSCQDANIFFRNRLEAAFLAGAEWGMKQHRKKVRERPEEAERGYLG